MTDLSDLIARVEAGEGADRDLDWRVQKTLGLGDWPDCEIWPPFVVGSKADREIPTYTTSIDAVIALVPEGWDYSEGKCDGVGHANIWPQQQPFPADLDICTEATSPARALLAAVLRARSVGDE